MSRYEPNFIPSNPEKHHDYAVYRDVRIPMRDGVELSTNIFFPAKDGEVDFSKKYPILMNRTAYMATNGEYYTVPPFITYFAVELGYAVVINASRGTYLSGGGEMHPLRDEGWGEHPDGVDTVKWLTSQPWSNGQVATCGGSWIGMSQYALWLADDVPDGLVTSVIQCPAVNIFGRGMAFRDEFVDLSTIPMWAFSMSKDQIRNNHLPDETVGNIVKGLAQLGDALHNLTAYTDLDFAKLASEYGLINIPSICHVPFYKNFLANRDNREYFSFIDTDTRKHDIKKPVMFVSGWYDLFADNTMNGFTRMVAEAPTEEVAKGHRLLMGPWGHTGYMPLHRQFPEADLDLSMMNMEFIQQHINGIPSKFFDENPVTIFVMGENRWRGEQAWPLADAQIKKLYLHSNGPANTMLGKGTLSEAFPAADEKTDTYTADPANPIYAEGGHGLKGGSADQRFVELRSDMLCYTSDVLEEDLEVTGNVRATLYAATSAEDTDFFMKLVDVCPDGPCYNVVTGGRRGRYLKNGRTDPAPLTPGEINEYQIDLHTTCYVFKKGHRIRVDISSSDAKNADVNPNAFVDLNTATKADFVVANQMIYHDAEHPTVIELPVIPASHERKWIDHEDWPFRPELSGMNFLPLKAKLLVPDINLPVIRDRTELPTTTQQNAETYHEHQSNTSEIAY